MANGKIIGKHNEAVLVSGIFIAKCGALRIINARNDSGTIPVDGLQLSEQSRFTALARCRYFNGTSNVQGWLQVNGKMLYLLDDTTHATTGSFATGQIVYFV